MAVALACQVHRSVLKDVAAIVKDTMESSCPLSVPLIANLTTGPSWGDMVAFPSE